MLIRHIAELDFMPMPNYTYKEYNDVYVIYLLNAQMCRLVRTYNSIIINHIV